MKTKWKVVSPYSGIEEDAPASSVGGGNIAGLGVDHPDRPGSGEPGIDPKKKKKKQTRVSLKEGNRRWPFCVEATTQKRPQAPICLISDYFVNSSGLRHFRQ